MKKRVVVLGGSGFFGEHLVADLMRRSDAHVVSASRRPSEVGHEQVICDVTDPASVTEALHAADVVVHCAGPFQEAPLTVLDTAISMGVDYVDISEDRDYAQAVERRHTYALAQGVKVLNGCSVVPAISIAAARLLANDLDGVESVRTFAAPGTARTRGPAMFSTLLWLAGRGQPDLRRSGARTDRGWSDPEWVSFPPPVGRRLVYWAGGMADVDAVPAVTGARCVEFKAGSEHAWLNRMMGGLSRWQGTPARLRESWLLPAALTVSRVAGRWGSDHGAVMVEVAGRRSGTQVTTSMAIVADTHGGRIPVVPAALAVEALFDDSLPTRAGVIAATWLQPDILVQGCRARGLRVVRTRSPSIV